MVSIKLPKGGRLIQRVISKPNFFGLENRVGLYKGSAYTQGFTVFPTLERLILAVILGLTYFFYKKSELYFIRIVNLFLEKKLLLAFLIKPGMLTSL